MRQLFHRASVTSGAWEVSQPLITNWLNMSWIATSILALSSSFLIQALAVLYFLAHPHTHFSHFSMISHGWIKCHPPTTVLHLYHHISSWLLTFQLDSKYGSAFLNLRIEKLVIPVESWKRTEARAYSLWGLVSATKASLRVWPLATWTCHRQSHLLRSKHLLRSWLCSPQSRSFFSVRPERSYVWVASWKTL